MSASSVFHLQRSRAAVGRFEPRRVLQAATFGWPELTRGVVSALRDRRPNGRLRSSLTALPKGGNWPI